MCFSDEVYGVYLMFSQENWDIGKQLVDIFYNNVVIDGNNILDRKELEKSVGVLFLLSWKFSVFPLI